MTFDYVGWVEETKKLVRKYSTANPSIDNMLDLILMHANRGRFDEAERLKLVVTRMLGSIYQAKADQIPSMPIPEKMEGDIVIGRVFQGDNTYDEFKTPLKDLNRHVGIFASAGHGKTVLIVNLIRQIMEHNKSHPDTPINFLAFDFKQDFRHLRELPIVCLRWNWLRLNPLVPPEGVSEPDWFNLICSALAHTMGFYQASEYYLREVINNEHQRVKENSYVSLQKVWEIVEGTVEKSYRRDEYRNVVLNRLTTVTQVLHEVLDCEQGFPISGLLDYPVVIELDGLDEGVANFIVTLVLIYVQEYRKAQLHRGGLRHLIIFDEAHRIFYKPTELRSTEAEVGESPIQQLPRIIRDFDEGLIFSSQEPSKINDSVTANTDLKLVGYLGSGFDINAVQSIYRLQYEDSELIKKLKLGQWMAQKSGIPDPFLVQTQNYEFPKTVANDELKERMKEFVAKMQSEPKRVGTTMTDYVKLPALSDKAYRVLEHVGQKPLRNISQRYKELKIHPLDGKNAVKELCDRKYVSLKPIQLSSGRPSMYLELTQLGRALLQKNDVSLTAWDDYVGNVGLEHRAYQWLVANALKKLGYAVKKEYAMDGKRFDVYAERVSQSGEIRVDGTADYKVERRIGIEVCVSPKTNFFEAAKVADKLDEMLFICRDLSVVELMQKEMLSLGISEPKLKFLVAHRYLSELYSSLSKSEAGGE